MQSLHEEVVVRSLIEPQTAVATVTGTGIDIEIYDGNCLVIADVGAASDTDATCIVTVEGSLDGSTYPDTLVTLASFTAGDDNETSSEGFQLTKAYKKIRGVATVAGSGTPSFVITVLAVIPANPSASGLNTGVSA